MTLESPIIEMKKQKTGSKPEKSQADLRAALRQKLMALKPQLDTLTNEYQDALSNDEFEDKSGEPSGSGEKRQAQMQEKIMGIITRAEKMKKTLDSKEDIPATPEADITSLEPFLKTVFSVTPTNIENLDLQEIFAKENIDQLKQVDATKAGQYTLNPECIGLDYEKVKITTLDITTQDWYKKLPTKDLASIGEYLIKHYSDKYIIPDLSFWKWMIERGDKAPTPLKDGNWHFSFGSILRNSGAHARVPHALWNGSEFLRNANRLTNDWRSNYRVVLLERV